MTKHEASRRGIPFSHARSSGISVEEFLEVNRMREAPKTFHAAYVGHNRKPMKSSFLWESK